MAKNPVKYFVVDAFTDKAFKGSPAGVCLLEDVKDEEWPQAVASELNMATTAFLTRIADSDHELQSPSPRFALRWFIPVAEVELCGHPTLAASHVLFTYGLVNSDKIEFVTYSGNLTAKKIPETEASNSVDNQNVNAREDYLIELDFPVVPLAEFNSAEILEISKGLNGASVIEIKKTTTAEDLVVVLPSGKAVAELEPQFDEVKRYPGRGIIVTGPVPPEFDFCSRFFCPKFGVKEASLRSGVISLHLDEKDQRVLLRGKAVVVAEGSILV